MLCSIHLLLVLVKDLIVDIIIIIVVSEVHELIPFISRVPPLGVFLNETLRMVVASRY